MKLTIDADTGTLTIEDEGGKRSLPLYSREAFEAISLQWVRVGWNERYQNTFTWLGRPIIQLPEDMVRTQEVIYQLRPDLIIETGIAHGGSLVFYASLCKLIGSGRVVGIDVEIRPQNRRAIEQHPLAGLIELVEGGSTDPQVVQRVKSLVRPGEKVLVFLDSDHSRDHVAGELRAYADLVTSGSYIVATDGIMRDLHDLPRGQPEWRTDNPCAAVETFLAQRKDFVLEQPQWLFNESRLSAAITHWSDAWLKRR
jgi:cephalosporin hydroxylase